MNELEKIQPMTQEEQDNVAAQQIDRLAAQGLEVEVDPELAQAMGAFVEEAISDEDAEEARLDHLNYLEQKGRL